MRRLKDEAFLFLQQVMALLPDNPVFCRVRRAFYKPFLKKAGRFSAMSGLKIFAPEKVSIGDKVSMNLGVMINASEGGDIEIGDNVLIGPYCVLRSADHVFSDPARPIREQGHEGGKIRIEEDCWLASHVVVTQGVTIGRGSVIGAHSVVTKDIPPNSIAMGAPAQVSRKRA